MSENLNFKTGNGYTDISPKGPSAYGWVVTFVVWLTGVSMPLNMLKVSILAPALMQVFNIGADAMSWVMAMFYLMGAVLAIPSAFIVGKIGKRATFILSLACAIVGGLMGYFATDLPLFIASRVIEGIGFGLVATAAVPAISAWFPPQKRGVPLGVWAIYVTMAFLIGPRLFSGLYSSTGDYHIVWLICLIFNIVVLLALVIFYREPKFVFDDEGNCTSAKLAKKEQPHPMNFGRVFKNPAVWLIGIIFFCEEVPFLGMSNFLTTYASHETTISLTTMSTIISVMAIVGCVMNPIAGKISDKIHSNKKLMVISCLGGTAYAFIVFQTTTTVGFIPVIVLNAVAGGIIPTMIWSAIPKVVEYAQDIPVATGIVLFFQQMAAFLGSRILGAVVEGFGSFSIAGQFFMAPIFFLGLVVLIIGWKKIP